MGGGNSIENTVNDTINATTDTVTNVLQSSSTTADLSQSITVDCNEFNNTKTLALNNCIATLLPKTNPDDATKNCKLLFDSLVCGANNISFGANLNANITPTQSTTIATSISNDITDKLTSALKQDNGFLEFGNKAKNDITHLTNVLTSVISTSLQEIASGTEGRQTLNVTGGTVSFISFDVTLKNVVNTIQTNSEVTDAKNILISTLTADTEQTNSTSSLLQKIFIGIIVVLAIILIIILILRFMGNKKDKSGTNIDTTVKTDSKPSAVVPTSFRFF
jgi:hypothetical protein